MAGRKYTWLPGRYNAPSCFIMHGWIWPREGFYSVIMLPHGGIKEKIIGLLEDDLIVLVEVICTVMRGLDI